MKALRCINLDVRGLSIGGQGSPGRWSDVFWDFGWPASTLPGISSKSCSLRWHPDWTSHCLVVQKRFLLSSESSWHHRKPGYANGEVWVLRVDHASPCLLSLNCISNKRSLQVFGGSRGREGALRPILAPCQGCLAGPSPRAWGNLRLWQDGKVDRGRSDSGRHEVSSCPFPSREPLSYPELIFLQTLIP